MGHQKPRGHGADKRLSLTEEKENTQVNQTEEGQREKSPPQLYLAFPPISSQTHRVHSVWGHPTGTLSA